MKFGVHSILLRYISVYCSYVVAFLRAGKGYPFYGVQWHPEKSGFEWSTKESINHSQHAVVIMQMAANFFVSEGD